MEIVVGTDGSAGGDRAVRWAAREARLSGHPLRILTTVDWNWTSGRFTGGISQRQLAEEAAATVLADARLSARGVAPDVVTRCEAAVGGPASVLITAARQAVMLVVGSRGRGGFASLLLGSVGQQAAMHAPCPVTVVRGNADMRAGPVTVGVDHGPAVADTLATAFGLAAERHAALCVIHAYLEPGTMRGTTVPPLIFDPERIRRDALAALEREITPWREKFPGVPVEARVVAGDVRPVLTEASATAQLLVVGGRPGVAGAVLGSVTLRLLHHADCPVVVAHAQGFETARGS
ncbi:universal stress protein [Catenuloplanes indicus]|uniref:Nucleotide-binding universal stress UspA family protein n=1 Tax=Catenuloplanes indicus TaxID=137267 RepID=A0AAE3VV42_9ACTN|nr:universal stress protein [Catenuloplanes indicus]MDQ0363580.1 nucleotide-binding universal stress UspA family protein [Catenuloplanes indicus]